MKLELSELDLNKLERLGAPEGLRREQSALVAGYREGREASDRVHYLEREIEQMKKQATDEED